VKTDDSGKINQSVISVDITGKGDVENKATHSVGIPPATVLAYSCNEFSINSAGMASLHSTIDINDTSKDPLFLKNGDGADPGIVIVTFDLYHIFGIPIITLLKNSVNKAILSGA